MSKTNFIIFLVLVIAVLYFVVTKANTALSKGQDALRKEAVTPENQEALEIMGEVDISR